MSQRLGETSGRKEPSIDQCKTLLEAIRTHPDARPFLSAPDNIAVPEFVEYCYANRRQGTVIFIRDIWERLMKQPCGYQRFADLDADFQRLWKQEECYYASLGPSSQRISERWTRVKRLRSHYTDLRDILLASLSSQPRPPPRPVARPVARPAVRSQTRIYDTSPQTPRRVSASRRRLDNEDRKSPVVSRTRPRKERTQITEPESKREAKRGTNSGPGDWVFFDHHGKMQRVVDSAQRVLNAASIGRQVTYYHGRWKYTAVKSSATIATQSNAESQKTRHLNKFMLWQQLTAQIFMKTMAAKGARIVKIERVHTESTSVFKHLVYGAKAQKLKEKLLFHGTKVDVIPKIIENGFNRDFSSRQKYGKGVYFARDASYSHHYSGINARGERVMLMCRVAVGDCCIGKQEYQQAPFKSDGTGQYDCMVNNLENPSIFVVMKDYHAVPTRKITYVVEEKARN